MKTEDIQQLRTYCEDFKKFRDNTENGDGQNLHDIKNTFDYVVKYAGENGLTQTVFGDGLAAKATEAANVLSQLWLCFDNLEKSIEGFCENQERNNNRSQ